MKTPRLSVRLLVSTCALLGYAAAHAHHSGVMFDQKKVVELTGVVKEFQYSNPHAWLIVDVANPDGTVTTWGFEAGAGPSILMQAGIRKTDLPPGTKVTMTAHPMRNGKPAGDWLVVTRLSDGKKFNPRATEEGDTIGLDESE